MRRLRLWTSLLTLVVGLDARAGSLSMTPPTLDFGAVPVTAGAASSTVTITNSGTSTTITGFVSGPGCGEFTATATGVLPVTLSNQQSLDVTVTYDPANRGSDACTITIQDSNGATDTFGLAGTGDAPKLSVASGALTFADQAWMSGTPETLNVSLENTGNLAISTGHLSRVLTTGVHFSLGTTVLPIDPGGIGIVPVIFDPTSVGVKNDVLTLSLDNDLPGDPSPTVSLSGAGIEEPAGVGDSPGITALVSVGPSPTRGTLSVRYSLAKPGRVSIEVCDLSGRIVGRTVSEESAVGVRSATWRDGIEWSPSAGVYFVRFTFDGRVFGSRRVVVIR